MMFVALSIVLLEHTKQDVYHVHRVQQEHGQAQLVQHQCQLVSLALQDHTLEQVHLHKFPAQLEHIQVQVACHIVIRVIQARFRHKLVQIPAQHAFIVYQVHT